jgi:hypothetical protein
MADDFDRTFDPSVDLGGYETSEPVPAPPACSWCNSPLDDPSVRVCPHCGAALRPEGDEPAVPGVTVTPWDPRVARAASDALASAAGAGLPDDALDGTGHPAFAPPAPEVRRAMRDVAASTTAPAAADGGSPVKPEPPVAPAGPAGFGGEEFVPPRRLPVPGPSSVPELELTVGRPGPGPGLRVHVGMTAPSMTDDGWWLAVLFARDDAGLVEAEEVASPGGPPAVPPLAVMGPVFSGALSGMVAEEGGRQQLRLALPASDDEHHPWRRPLVVRLAVRWEPARAATMTQEQLASDVVAAFRRALEAAGGPT